MDFKSKGADDGSRKGDVAQTTKEVRRIEAVMLSMVYSAIILTPLDKWIIYLLVICDGFQLLHFSWKEQFMLGESFGTFFSSIGGFTTDYSTFQVLFYLAFTLVLLNAITIVVIGALLHIGQFRRVWPLNFLRIFSLIVKTVLLIPITNIFVSGLHCNYGTGNLVLFPDQECFNENLFPYSGSIIGLCILIPYSLLTPIALLDARPSPKHFLGTRAQGRTEAIYSGSRMALVFLHVLSTGSEGSAYVGLISNVVLFGYIFSEYVVTLPFYAFTLNRIRAGFLMAVFLSSVSAIVSYSVLADEASALTAQIVTAIIGYLVGFMSPTITRRKITETVYARVKEEIDLKGTSRNSSKEGVTKPASSQRVMEDALDDKTSFLIRSSKINLIARTHTVERPPIFERETDVEIACRFVRNNNSADGKGLMHFIFHCGLQQYPKSAFLHATYASYTHEFDSGKDKQAQELVRQCSRQLKPKFTDRILLFFIERSLETALRPKGSGDDDNPLSLSSFAEYQSLEATARVFHTQTLEELRAFWGYLASANVSVRVLPVFAQKILSAELKGDEYYAKLVSRFPKSKNMLRMYATWLRQVKNDQELAQEFFELADQIENNETNAGVLNLNEDADLDDMADGNLDEDGSFADMEDKEQNIDSYGPDPHLLKKASQSLVHGSNLVFGSSFRLQDSNLNFSQPPVTTTANGPDASQQKAELLSDQPPKEDVQPEILGENDDVKLRQAAFLEPEGISVERRPSDRMVMISDVDDTENKRQDNEKEAYPKGPRSESNASSSASTKAVRAKRVQKVQLEIRLTNEIYTFGLRVIAFNLAFVGLIIATYIVASGQFTRGELQLAQLQISTRLAIRHVVISLALREQMLAAQVDDEQAFEKAKHLYLDELKWWRINALPFLQKYYNNPYQIRTYISQYPNGTGEYIWYNEYGVGALVYQNALQMNLTLQEFADPSIMTNNYFRFFGVPNTLDISLPLDLLSQRNQDDYVKMSGNSMTILYALMTIITFTVFVGGIGLFYPMIKHSGLTQVKVMKLFTLLPKKACRHIYTNIEEDLENFVATGDDQEIQLANEAKMRVSSVSTTGDLASQSTSKKYLQLFAIWLGAILITTLVVFAPPVVFELDGVMVAKAINWSDSRRYKIGAVMRASTELACRDEESYMDFIRENAIVATLKDQIKLLDDYNQLVTSDHGGGGVKMDIAPLANMEYIRDITSIPGTCLLLTPGACNPKNRIYNASIGLTQDVVLSGLDNLMDSYIEAAKRFAGANPANLDLKNRYYVFMRSVLEDLRGGLTLVVYRLTDNQVAKSTMYKTIMTVLFPIALLVVACSYIAFRKVVRSRILEMHQIIQLLFSIPIPILEENPQLVQYIQSGGVMGLDE